MPPCQQIAFSSASSMMLCVVFVTTLSCTLNNGLVSCQLDAVIENKPNGNPSYQPTRRRLVKLQANRTSGNGMATHDSNTTPNGNIRPNDTPNPKTINECDKEWKEWFSERKAKDAHERNCCYREKMCDCINEICQKHPDTDGCTKLCISTLDCFNNTIPLDQCMTLPVIDGLSSHRPTTPVHGPYSHFPTGPLHSPSSKDSVSFNWLWIILLAAVVIIIIIVLAICFVYRNKFCRQNSSSDAKHASLKFGQKIVVSNVKLTSKSSLKGDQ